MTVGMKALYLVLGLIALGLFAAIVLSVAVVIFMVALAGWMATLVGWFRIRKPRRAVKVMRVVQEAKV
jgi:hypothetical protein